jgi:hypothetical protein
VISHLDIKFLSLANSTKLLLCTELFYILTIIVLKLSIGMFFLRILIERWHRLLLISIIAIANLFGVAHFFFAIFQCGLFSHINTFITRMVAGTCAKPKIGLGMNYTFAILTTISDLVCGLLPIFILRESNMPTVTKIAIGCVLAIAAV